MDNSTSAHYLNVRFGAVESLDTLVRHTEAIERRAMCWACTAHISGRNNVIADKGSRRPDFSAAWAGDKYAHATLRRTIFLALQARLGWQFSLDLFADREGRTALTPAWRSPENTAFEADINDQAVWCHPPPSLLLETFRWADEQVRLAQQAKIANLAPLDEAAP